MGYTLKTSVSYHDAHPMRKAGFGDESLSDNSEKSREPRIRTISIQRFLCSVRSIFTVPRAVSAFQCDKVSSDRDSSRIRKRPVWKRQSLVVYGHVVYQTTNELGITTPQLLNMSGTQNSANKKEKQTPKLHFSDTTRARDQVAWME
jgi:hypothetical protein